MAPAVRPKTARAEDVASLQSLLAALVESSNDAIISKDLDGTITSRNPAAEWIYGYTDSEIVGRSITLLAPPDRPDEILGILRRVAAGERVDHFETQRRRKDGTLLDVSLSVSPIRDADGKVIGASVIGRDFTAAKRAEEALRKAVEELRERTEQLVRSNTELQRFAYVASHDLQEPARTVASYCGLLEQRYGGQLDETAREWIGHATAGAQRMRALISDLLEYSQVEFRAEPLIAVESNAVLTSPLPSGPRRRFGRPTSRSRICRPRLKRPRQWSRAIRYHA